MARWTVFVLVIQTGCKPESNRTPVFSRSHVLPVMIVQIFSKVCCKSCVRSLSLKSISLCVCVKQACSLWNLRRDSSKNFTSENGGFLMPNAFCIFALAISLTYSFSAITRLDQEANCAVLGKDLFWLGAVSWKAQELWMLSVRFATRCPFTARRRGVTAVLRRGRAAG